MAWYRTKSILTWKPRGQAMKPKLYLETTIVGYLAARKSRDLVTAAR